MLDALKADAFQQYRRAMPLILAVFMVALISLLYVLLYVNVQNGGSGSGPFEDVALDELKLDLQIDRVMVFGSQLVVQFGSVLAVILAGSSTGAEFSSGTVRTRIMRTKARWHFVGAKLVNGMAFALVLAAIGLATALLVSAIITPNVDGDYGGLASAGFYGDMAAALLRDWWAISTYVVLAVLLAVWTRSTAVAVGVSLGVLILQGLFVSLLGTPGGLWEELTKVFPSSNVSGLLEANGNLTEGHGPFTIANNLPGAIQATLVLGAYIAGFAAYALVLFQRRDISTE